MVTIIGFQKRTNAEDQEFNVLVLQGGVELLKSSESGQFYATANLRNWMAFYRLRSADDAQWEIRKYAQAIGAILEKIWPEGWGSLKKSL